MEESKKKGSALKVNDGIAKPSSVDEKAAERFKTKKKRLLSLGEFVNGFENLYYKPLTLHNHELN